MSPLSLDLLFAIGSAVAIITSGCENGTDRFAVVFYTVVTHPLSFRPHRSQ